MRRPFDPRSNGIGRSTRMGKKEQQQQHQQEEHQQEEESER